MTSKSKRDEANPGTYASGVGNFEQIIKAARWVLIEKGHAALTLKSVADRSGLGMGHLYYYTPSKRSLIQALVESLFESYRPMVAEMENRNAGDPEAMLIDIMTYWMEENQTRDESRVFTELWAMANHDLDVRKHLELLYSRGQERVESLIMAMNPELSQDHRKAILICIWSLMEGTMLFSSYGKPAVAPPSAVASLVVQTVLDLIRDGHRRDLRFLSDRWRVIDTRGDIVDRPNLEV